MNLTEQILFCFSCSYSKLHSPTPHLPTTPRNKVEATYWCARAKVSNKVLLKVEMVELLKSVLRSQQFQHSGNNQWRDEHPVYTSVAIEGITVLASGTVSDVHKNDSWSSMEG